MGYLLEEGEASAFEASEAIDFDYEYDAPMYFDFTSPESNLEVNEADRWFESAQSYPPSPFLVKWKRRIDEWMDRETSSSKCKEQQNADSTIIDASSEVSSLVDDKRGQMPRLKSKSPLKPFLPRSSTLLEPTASHLAKQNQQLGVCSANIVRGIQKIGSPKKHEEIDATKRHKLEIGFLRRVANLKHQILSAHKSPKKIRLTDVNSATAKGKFTIPKELELETALRAQKHRSKNSSQTDNSTKRDDGTFKVLPLNRKILDTPSLLQREKSTPQLPMFQVFLLRTSERIMQQSSQNVATVQTTNSATSNKTVDLKRYFQIKVILAFPVTRSKRSLSQSKRHSQNPPIELFNKLSLTSENKLNELSEEKQPPASKGPKENALSFFKQENKEKSSRCGMKQSQFVRGRTIAKVESHPAAVRYMKRNMGRS